MEAPDEFYSLKRSHAAIAIANVDNNSSEFRVFVHREIAIIVSPWQA
jgi:hypothetical protein